jgi:hypothetical protein
MCAVWNEDLETSADGNNVRCCCCCKKNDDDDLLLTSFLVVAHLFQSSSRAQTDRFFRF